LCKNDLSVRVYFRKEADSSEKMLPTLYKWVKTSLSSRKGVVCSLMNSIVQS